MDQPKITQAMIKAYDDYTHLTLDRRDFMKKLQMLAGSAGAAAAIAPLLAASSARADIVPPDDNRLEAEDVTYAGAPGEIRAYMAAPKGVGKLPAVIVIHENRGLNNHIRDVTRRLALEGFLAMAPDLLSPAGGTPSDEDKAREMISALNADINRTNLMAAVEFLKTFPKSSGKVGAVGFCWGGGWVNQLAVAAPDLLAGVAYYGMQPPADDVPKIKASLMLHYAGLDDRINAGIDAYKKALEASSKDFQIFVYDKVNHAFNNDTSSARYNKQAADLAWGRTVGFLKEKLG
ncbi:MAG: dienelactone hydrolase family protein [Rhizobium sp.]|nr:dienelactone hydrolase family protein [Rhizobium sp.]